jgi:hypothetical protein
MKTWEALSHPPPHALKTIGAGRLKGKTDINPQWRLQAMTEHFGQIGVGWYYDIVKLWTENGSNGELMCFVHIQLFTKLDNGEWSMPIVGIGGSALVAKEASGLHANDEGYKMALTDALSVAMKQLGVASAIYEGLWDGTKYREIAKQLTPNEQKQTYKESLKSARTLEELTAAWDKIPREHKVQELINAASERKRELDELQEQQ